MPETSPVLDPRQLIRIEAVHRGFFFQHLYAVAILLSIPGSTAQSLAIERDEDLEVRRDGSTTYLQVKSRLGLLQPHDVADTLGHFELLRNAHGSGQRLGAATFAIVCNSEPSPALLARINSPDWPADVEVITPGRPSGQGLPAAAPTTAAALEACEAAAAAIPFGNLPPATLVLKLASVVQYHASGAGEHVITAEALSPMLEQIVAQLHDFPEPPRPYHPQRNEPLIVSDQRVRLIVGFSGAGKTAWAAEAVRHHSDPVAYFDAGGYPSTAVAGNLARELVAQFVGSRVEGARLPPGVGLDLLRAADALLAEQGTRALVVMDNAHLLDAETFRQIVEAAPNTSFLFLAQPWTDRALIEAQLHIQAEGLEGYDPDTLAAIFAAQDVGIEHQDALDVLSLTGGLPLYVANAAQLTASHYDGNVRAFIDAIRAQTHIVETAQQLILERSFESLSPGARDAAALLGMCDVPISDAEAAEFLSDLGSEAERARALRQLGRASMIVTSPQGIKLHDALRGIAGTYGTALNADRVSNALQRLHPMLMASLRKSADIPRLTFMVRLLPRVGRSDALIDLATSEIFYEQGNHAILLDTLIAASNDDTGTPLDRFWAMDAVAYWQSRDGGTPERELVDRMARLVDEHPDFESRERLNLLFKQLTIAATDGDRGALERLSAVGRRLTNGKPLESRLFRYNRAVALYRLRAYDAVRAVTEPLLDEMFEVLGFAERALFGANGAALIELLGSVDDHDDVKRTADILNLWASAVAHSGHAPGLRRIQASKLFAVSGAARSAAAAAMDSADEFLEFMADPVGARQAIEQHVLPLIAHYGLTDLTLEARGQYAVVLAYNGDFDAADREVAALRNFGGNHQRVAELENQAALIEHIRAGEVRLRPRLPQERGMHPVLQPNLIGRRTGPDELCPCGSGRKFKRCHGARR